MKSCREAVMCFIVIRMMKHGELYSVDDGIVPDRPHLGGGYIVQAQNLNELRTKLGLTDHSMRSFHSAFWHLGRQGRIARCHIDGRRHYKLMGVFGVVDQLSAVSL